MGGSRVSRKRMMDEAYGLLDPMEAKRNKEYERGMAELIARCFLKEDTADERDEVIRELRGRLAAERARVLKSKRGA